MSDNEWLKQHPDSTTPAFLRYLDAEVARRKFKTFVKQAWPIIEPGIPLVWCWALDAMCFPGSAMISTAAGDLAIGEIVDRHVEVPVVSWNHLSRKIEHRKITRWVKSRGRGLLTLTTSSGKTLILTKNHPVYVDGVGYVESKKY